MPRRAADDDYPDDWYDDPDGAADEDELPEGVYHDDDLPTVRCRYCGKDKLEDAEQCPHCENYQSAEENPGPSRSRLWWGLMVLALLCAAFWVLAP